MSPVHKCPDCPYTADTYQGIGAHRRRIHPLGQAKPGDRRLKRTPAQRARRAGAPPETREPAMRDEYDLRGGERGKYLTKPAPPDAEITDRAYASALARQLLDVVIKQEEEVKLLRRENRRLQEIVDRWLGQAESLRKEGMYRR